MRLPSFRNIFSGMFRKSAGFLKKQAPSLLFFFWWIVAFALGGWFLARGGEYLFFLKALEESRDLPVMGAWAVTSGSENDMQGIRAFLEERPFGVPPRAEQAPVKAPPATKSEGPDLKSLIAGMRLVGTISGLCGFVESGNDFLVLYLGQEFHGCRVHGVFTSSLVLSRGEERYTLPLVFSGTQSPVLPPKNAARPKPAQTTSLGTHAVQAAAPGQSGRLSRKRLNDMLMNPFDELKKVRFAPKIVQGKPQGLEVQYIEKSSVLSSLGVRKDDVVQGINGITISNMGDVANAVNSLMGGSRFDVTVIRNGKEESLRYEVQ